MGLHNISFKKVPFWMSLGKLIFIKGIHGFTIVFINVGQRGFVRTWILPFLQANKLIVSLMLSLKTLDS